MPLKRSQGNPGLLMRFKLPPWKNFLVLFLLALSLAVVTPQASAQILLPSVGGGTGESGSSTPWWDTSRANRCGRLWCSDVYLRGSSQVTLTVGRIPDPEMSNQANASAIEQRARQVQSIFDAVFFQLTKIDNVEVPKKKLNFLNSKVFDIKETSLRSYSDSNLLTIPLPASPNPSASPKSESAEPQEQSQNSDGKNEGSSPRPPATSLRGTRGPQTAIRMISPPAPRKGSTLSKPLSQQIHPLTPKVEVGIKNSQTVVFFPSQPELGLTQQTLVTVNQADEIANGKPVDILAHEWRNRIQDSFDKALWNHELDRQYPWYRYQLSSVFVVVAAVLVTILSFGRKFFIQRDRLLAQELRLLTQSLTKDIEAEVIDPTAEPTDTRAEPSEPGAEAKTDQPSQRKFPWQRPWVKDIPFSHELKDRVNNAWQNIGDLATLNLRQQTWLKQRRNLSVLLAWTLLWLQVSCIFITIAIIVYIFPGIRPFTILFIGQAMYFPLLWIGLTLLDKIAGIFVDGFLNRWAREQQRYKGTSNRYPLRVTTYSPAIKGGISFLLCLVGILGSIWLFGINPLVLASFGGVAFVLAFLARNVVEDMLNGTLILITDRYAIGDVVQVGDVSGLVEHMNIYITQLRGPEGRLTTIPNGKITIVENLTKEWSRAEFIVEIDQASDVDRALEVIKLVSEQMRADPLWQEKILEPAAILGVDNIASRGIQLQVWIKTQAGQHWAVGREFRLRVKKAFELAGIYFGSPHQQIVFHRNGKKPGENPAIAFPGP